MRKVGNSINIKENVFGILVFSSSKLEWSLLFLVVLRHPSESSLVDQVQEVALARICECDHLSEKTFLISWKLKSLSANSTKWSNTLKQFVGFCRRIVLGVSDHFVGLAFKSLTL